MLGDLLKSRDLMSHQPPPATPGLLGIVWPFIAIVGVLAMLSCGSLFTMSAVRAYVAGESFWSKGQKDAIYFLSLYADSGDLQIYQQYRQAMAVPEGGHLLRLSLERTPPDLDGAREGILQGNNHPDDVAGVIWLYQHFSRVSFMQRAIDRWQVGDRYLAQLSALAQTMHASLTAGTASPDDRLRWKREIMQINDGVTPAAMAFSAALSDGSRMVQNLLIAINLATVIVLIVLALWRTRTLLAQRQAVANELQTEKERAQVTLASIGDGVITTDVDGAIVYMNPAAEQLTHWQAEQAMGMALASLFEVVEEKAGSASHSLLEDIAQGLLRGGREHARSLRRLDGSMVSVTLVGAPLHTAGQVNGSVLVLHDMTQERQYIASLSWQASHDALTGLPNRREFEIRLVQALERREQDAARHSLIVLDIDQFKLVNDTCGHGAGDELLRRVCADLQAALGASDTLARLGSDEFGVLLENCSPQAASLLAERLRLGVRNLHFVWQGRPFPTTVSIGLVHMTSAPGMLETFLRAADMACYMAKEKGRNRVQVYQADDSEMSTRADEMAWVQRLHMALEDNRFCLYSQEIAPLGSRHDVPMGHLEVLLRLHDENGRIILPDAFIPAAERYGLMTALDRWVVHNVFRTIRETLDSGAHGPLPVCAINLSGTSVGDEQFLDYLHEQFDTFSIPAGMICFELTETSAIANLDSAVRFINELKARGCQFSLDDFCAGISSFANLKHLPVDFLKIDGSFVRNMLDDPVSRAIVEVIHRIGHVMGKRTIAEFVETPLIEQALLDVGVDFAQGYVVERPLPFTALTLQRRNKPLHRILKPVPGAAR